MIDANDQLKCALDLLRRMPPQKLENVLQSVLDIAPQLTESLLSSVDQPMKLMRDNKAGKDFLISEFNRDGDSYRSPWTNLYSPPLEDGLLPSERLREIEIDANNSFDQYREMYFGGGISSVYCWDLDQGFAMAILIKKTGEAASAKGCWDSVHVVEVQERPAAKQSHYKLSSTLIAWISTTTEKCGTSTVSGNISRLLERDFSTTENHISVIGSMVEDQENQMRSSLNEVYFGSSKVIIDSMRSFLSKDSESERRRLTQDITKALQKNSPL